MTTSKLGAALLSLAAIAIGSGGCDTTNTNNYFFSDLSFLQNNNGSDGGSGQGCKPNTKDCVSDSLARVCPADGSGWLPVQCAFGEICQAGDCVFDQTGTSCSAADNFCTGATTALVCNDNGVGFKMVTCPANTNCVGAGQCAGNCLVGVSFCADPSTVSVCADGQTFTSSACPAGQLCAGDGNGGGSCLANTCTPDTVNGCNAACGNKTADPGSTDTGFVSFCQETPQGWRWQTTNCIAPQACDPQAFNCDSGPGAQAGCITDCVPGSTTCSFDGSGVQTCSASTGKLGPVVPCDVASGQVCIQLNGTGAAMCGDPVCGIAPGACVGNGFRACNPSGKLSPSSVPCTTGRCQGSGQPVNGLQPGQCGVDCQPGDSQCASGTAVQTCVNGLWSGTTMQCTGTNIFCQSFFTDPPGNRPRALCGECAPGTHQCTDIDDVQACDATGHFTASPAPCVASHCGKSPTTGDEACIADCIPNKPVCGPTKASASPAPQNFGFTTAAVCTGDGQKGSFSNCSTGETCRKNSAGASLGCVVCVPVDNENGQTDTSCASKTSVETCNTMGTGWLTPQVCTNPTTCSDPTTPPAPPLFIGPYCHQCQDTNASDINDFDSCSDSGLNLSLQTEAGLSGGGCSFSAGNVGWNEGPPVPCAGDSQGQTFLADCCAFDCFADAPPLPAVCQ